MIDSLFPTGVWKFIIGGILVGIGMSLNYVFTGRIGGVSSFFSSVISFFSPHKYFHQKHIKDHRIPQLILAIGIFSGGLLFMFFNGSSQTSVQWWRLLIGGIFVGFGARYSKGCTSGHGICGLSSFSKHSALAVVIFLVVAFVVAFLVQLLGVTP